LKAVLEGVVDAFVVVLVVVLVVVVVVVDLFAGAYELMLGTTIQVGKHTLGCSSLESEAEVESPPLPQIAFPIVGRLQNVFCVFARKTCRAKNDKRQQEELLPAPPRHRFLH
jgi:hypothetical protein